MRKKDVIILKYKIITAIPKVKSNEEPDWESMKIDPTTIKQKFNTQVSWIRKTFEKNGFISIEELEEGSVVNHDEGVFIVNTKFKKLFKLIYK